MSDQDAIAISEAQLILSEKRTALSMLRTGLTIFILPLSILSVLIAINKHNTAMMSTVVLGIFCCALIILGTTISYQSLLKIRKYNKRLKILKSQHSIFNHLG